MKRLFVLLLCAVLAVSFCGCSSAGSTGSDGTAEVSNYEPSFDGSAGENKENASHKHSYKLKSQKAATCTAAGSKSYVCSCGNGYTETVNPLGHSFGEWKTSGGVMRRTCTRCGYVEEKKSNGAPSPDASGSGLISQSQLDEIAAKFLVLVNEERAKTGAAALKRDGVLDYAAQVRSSEIVGLFSHNRPDGTKYLTAIDTSAYPYSTCGENIVMTSHLKQGDAVTEANAWKGTAAQLNNVAQLMFDIFKNSPGHYANMIEKDFKDCGVGITYTVKSGVPYFYCSHIFGTRQ